MPVERARQRVRVAEARLAGLEDLDEHEQEDELRYREDTGQPRRLPADHPLVDEDVERDAHHQVHPDRHDPALVAEQDREEGGEQHGPGEREHPCLDPADDRRAHQEICAVRRVRRIARAVSEASESWSARREESRRRRSRSASAQSITKRRPTYLSPAIVSAWGMTLLASRPSTHSRDSARSSPGTPQLESRTIRSSSTGSRYCSTRRRITGIASVERTKPVHGFQ